MTAGTGDRGLETPLADLVEQLTPVEDDPETGDITTGSALGLGDADEADALEQAIPVPIDDGYPQGGAQ